MLVCVFSRLAYMPFQLLKRNGFNGPKPSFFYGNFKEKIDKVRLTTVTGTVVNTVIQVFELCNII